MGKIVADGSEGVLLVFPVPGEIDFAASGGGHALKHGVGDRLEVGFLGAHHVDGRAGGLRQLGNVFGRDHAVVIGTVGEDYDYFSSGEVGGILHGEQQAIVERSVVTGDGGARGA